MYKEEVLRSPVVETWVKHFAFLDQCANGNGVSAYFEGLLDMWDALGQPELRLGHGMVINNLRSWLSGPLLLSNLLAVSREVARLDGLDEPLMPELVGGYCLLDL
jgi:hypothetical protein